MNLLYVDDEPINIELFQLNFENIYTVFVASSAKEGLEIIKRQDIKVIVTDFKMPVMNGIEFINEVKKMDPSKICIILSGYVDKKIVSDPESNLVFDYVTKPWNKRSMQVVIDKALMSSGNLINR
jgi:YesN/AraC family two-component response regulator